MVSQSTCCNSCNDVKEAYEKRGWLLTDLDGVEQCAREGVKTLAPADYDPSEGCNVKGYIEVLKLSGKFHLVRLSFACWPHDFILGLRPLRRSSRRVPWCVCAFLFPGSNSAFSMGFGCPHSSVRRFLCYQQTPGHSIAWKGHNLHDMSVFRNRQLDLSHTIRSLSFGAAYPGQKNPLDGTVKSLPAEQSMGQHEYFIKLVPTTYKKARGRSLKTNQVRTTQLSLGALSHAESNAGIFPSASVDVSCILSRWYSGVCSVQVFNFLRLHGLSYVISWSPLFSVTVLGDRILQAERPK